MTTPEPWLLERGARALLLAPHCDDEALGAGGCAALWAKAGVQVQPVIVASSPGVQGGVDLETRHAESRASCESMGIAEPLFLDVPSAELREDPSRGRDALLHALAERTSFDAVLLPWPLERHDTHRATLIAGLLAAPALADAHTRWWGFGVWDAIPRAADVVTVDITAVRAQKTRAVAAHRSQNEARPFGAAVASRDLAQAVFTEVTGEETRRAVEHLLPLDSLLAELQGASAEGLKPTTCASAVGRWATAWSAAWVASLWPPAS